MADLRRERAGRVDHGSLECPVMRKRTTGLTLIAGGRGDVDDRAAFRLTHVRHCGAAAISHGAVIGGEDLLDVGVTRRRAPAAAMRTIRSPPQVTENMLSAEPDGRFSRDRDPVPRDPPYP